MLMISTINRIHAQGTFTDIVELWPSWNWLYRESLLDLTDMAEEVGTRGGGFEAYVLNSAKVGGRWTI